MATLAAFSIAIDESIDIADIAQRAIVIRGVYVSLSVTEAFVHLVPMTGMTQAEDIFGSCCQCYYRWCSFNDWNETWCCSKIEGESAYSEWMARPMDFALHYPRSCIILKVSENGPCNGSC